MGSRKKQVKIDNKKELAAVKSVLSSKQNNIIATDARQLLLKGFTINQSLKELCKKHKNKQACIQILTLVKDELFISLELNTRNIVSKHVMRYDHNIEELLSFVHIPKIPSKPWIEKEMKINAYLDAIDTLVAKEKLLKLHSSTVRVYVAETIDELIEEEQIKKTFLKKNQIENIDITALTIEERIKFYELIEKSEIKETEILEEEFTYIEYEEVRNKQQSNAIPEVNPFLTQKVVDSEEKEKQRFIESTKIQNQSKNIIDTTVNLSKGKNLSSLKQQLTKALLNQTKND